MRNKKKRQSRALPDQIIRDRTDHILREVSDLRDRLSRMIKRSQGQANRISKLEEDLVDIHRTLQELDTRTIGMIRLGPTSESHIPDPKIVDRLVDHIRSRTEQSEPER